MYAPFMRGVTQAVDAAGFMPLVTDTEDGRARLVRVLRHLEDRLFVEAPITIAAPEAGNATADVRSPWVPLAPELAGGNPFCRR